MAAILVLGLLIRLPFAPIDFRASNDLDVYKHWGRTAHATGLLTLYERTSANYPPLLLYWFSGAAAIEAHIAPESGDKVLTALIKLPSMLADVLTAALIASMVRGGRPGRRLFICGLYTFNPAIWYVSTYWGQTDSVYTLFLVACVIALSRRAILSAWALYVLALGTKIQSVALAPLLISATGARSGVYALARGFAIAAITGAIIAGPWLLSGRIGEVVQSSLTTPNTAPRLDVSGYNLWYLVRLGRVHNFSSTHHPASLPFSYQTLSLILFGVCVAFIALLTWRQRARSLALPAALLCISLFMLLTEVHERHLFPALALLLLTVARQPDLNALLERRSLWRAYGLLSLTFLFNLVTVAPFTPLLGTNLIAAPIDSPGVLMLKALSVLVAAVNLILFAWLIKVYAQDARHA
ncbi:MAG TPA: hypothetical protein VJG32_17365 [Anaerolineae bacterium]|nr:hypothetical protein [Anaerolineae bacterium]